MNSFSFAVPVITMPHIIRKPPKKQKTKPAGIGPSIWRKGIAAASALRQEDARTRALTQPNLMSSYIAGDIAEAPRVGGMARIAEKIDKAIDSSVNRNSMSSWSAGRSEVPPHVMSVIIPGALRWALSVRDIVISAADAAWIGDRLYPTVLEGGVLFEIILTAAVRERLNGITLSQADLVWLKKALLSAHAQQVQNG